MAKNQLKSEIPDSEEKKPRTKKKRRKKNGKLAQFRDRIQQFTEFLKNEKTRQILGLLLLFFSVCLLVALTSFLFTWKADQSKIEFSSWDLLTDASIQAENWLGSFGAFIAHVFIHEWFGVASYLFIGFFFLIGFRLLFRIDLLPFSRSFRIGFFTLIWLSITMSYLFSGKLFFLGGAFGYEVNRWLGSLLGKVGTGFLILTALFAFLLISFNISFDFLKKKPAEEEDATETEEDVAAVTNQVKQDEATGELPLQAAAEETPLVVEDTVVQASNAAAAEAEEATEKESLEMELSTESTTAEKEEEKTEAPKDDIEFSIEETPEEEPSVEESGEPDLVKEFGEYDPTLDLANYEYPTLELLQDHGDGQIKVDKEELELNKDRIVNTLENYNIKIQSIKATIGPTVTLYEIVPAPGVRISKIKNLEDDIALSLAALGIRIIAPIPGRGTIGIEVPNQNPDIVSMRTVITSEKFQKANMNLPVVIGKTISNEVYTFDLAKMPHLLMAGATGQGKSVGLNAVLTSLLYKKHPAQLKFVLVDPKKVELTLYNKIERHFLAKLPDTEEAIITDNQKVINTLNSLCIEMDQRYELLKTAFVRNIKEYNAKFISRKLNPENGHKYLPYIVVVIDEFADLIMTAGKEVETPIARLAQLARAIGIHLIIATQRPSTNIITGSIKANFPARVAFRVTSGIDSRTILDSGGAEQLIGRGDMLLSTGNDLIRLQCAFIDTPEVEKLTEFIGSQRAYPDAFILPEYVDESASNAGDVDLDERDALFDDAARIIVQHQQGSASLLQRRLKLGYNRAGRIIDQLEAAGIIGPFEGSKARQVLVADEASLEQFLKNLNEQ